MLPVTRSNCLDAQTVWSFIHKSTHLDDLALRLEARLVKRLVERLIKLAEGRPIMSFLAKLPELRQFLI